MVMILSYLNFEQNSNVATASCMIWKSLIPANLIAVFDTWEDIYNGMHAFLAFSTHPPSAALCSDKFVLDEQLCVLPNEMHAGVWCGGLLKWGSDSGSLCVFLCGD